MDALSQNQIVPCTTQFCGNNVFSDAFILDETIRRTLQLPEVFVCANDFTAIDLIRALRRHSIKVPDDVCITGFDNSTESKIIEPHLTTIDIPSAKMGYIAADLLLSRIREPEIPYRITHVRTDIKFRSSTEKAYLR